MAWYRRLSSPSTNGGIGVKCRSFPAVIRVRAHCCLGNAGGSMGGNPSTWAIRGSWINYWGLFRNDGNMLNGVYMQEC